MTVQPENSIFCIIGCFKRKNLNFDVPESSLLGSLYTKDNLNLTAGTACKKMKKLAFKFSSISWQKQPHNGIPVRFTWYIVINAAL